MRKSILLLWVLCPLFLQAQYVDYWTGKLNFGMEVTIELNVTYEELQPIAITMDCPEQSIWTTPCELLKWSKDSFNVRIAGANVVFKGSKQQHDSVVVGKWIQNGMELPLNLTRSVVGISPVRPQNPVGEVPYLIEDLRIPNKKDQVELSATLTLPKASAIKGCAILITGSGKQDKDESIMGHQPFWIMADYLTRNGFAVLRFDDRGCYKSTGNFDRSTIFDFANDVNAAIDVAKDRTGLDDSKIGLIGHSEGSMVAQIVIKTRPMAFYISLAGPAAPVRDLMFQQNRDLREMFGIKTEEFDKTVAPFLKKVLAIAGDLSLDSAAASAKIIKQYKKVEKKFSTQAKTRFALGTPEGAAGWLNTPLRVFLSYVPADYLAQIKIPVLALNGSVDKQVNSQINLQVFKKYAGNNPLNEIVELPNKNHLFQTTTKGDISEYGKLEESFSPDALQIMVNWLNKIFAK
jgi:pimeloyl-ACP methyl ester carboxylesterase